VQPEIHFCVFDFEDVESTKKVLKLNKHTNSVYHFTTNETNSVKGHKMSNPGQT